MFLSKFEVVVVGGGGGLAPDPPITTTPKLQLDFLDLPEPKMQEISWNG